MVVVGLAEGEITGAAVGSQKYARKKKMRHVFNFQ